MTPAAYNGPMRVVLVLSLIAALLVGGCHSQTYWYCWNTGSPQPHHLGHPVSGDHYCSDEELRPVANPTQ